LILGFFAYPRKNHRFLYRPGPAARKGEILMMDAFRAALEAHDPSRGCYRAYRLEAGTDLFGAWPLTASYSPVLPSWPSGDEAGPREMFELICHHPPDSRSIAFSHPRPSHQGAARRLLARAPIA
jgi:hypothetical protein